jgi:6-phosphogluconolactonase
MKNNSLFLFLFLLGSVLTIAQRVQPLYVGTYTNGDSEGVYEFAFNPDSGTILRKSVAVKATNPSFLTRAKKGLLYTVNEVGNFQNKKTGYLSGYKIFKNKNTKTGDFQLINRVSSNGDHPCHIALNKAEDLVVVSNYSGGTVSIHRISENGAIEDAHQVFDHNTNVRKSHVHYAQFIDDDLFVADLGLNSLFHYIISDKENRKYILKTTYFLGDDSGPRHFEVAQDGAFIYVINELNSSITVLQKNDKEYSEIQNISTLADGFEGENSCADIHMSEDQHFIYGSNRGENSIAVFKRNMKTGKLEKIQSVSTHGDWPRNFTLSPRGKYLLVANQKSNNISIFGINKKTGKLYYKSSEPAPSPVCLLF